MFAVAAATFGCARGTPPRSIAAVAGCYRLAWAADSGMPPQLLPWHPLSVRLLGGPDSGAVGPGPGSPDTLAFWQIHTRRSWARLTPDSVLVSLGHDMGGTALWLSYAGDSVVGASRSNGDVIPETEPPRKRVNVTRVSCDQPVPAA
jgi:hypothetical protein